MNLSILQRAPNNHLERGGQFKENLESDWMNHQFVRFKADQTIFSASWAI